MKSCHLILPLLCINHSLDTCSLYIVLTHEVWMSAVSVTAASNTLVPFSALGKSCFWSLWCQRSQVHPKSSSCISDACLFYIKAIRWLQSAGRWVGIVEGGLFSLWPAEGSVVNEERHVKHYRENFLLFMWQGIYLLTYLFRISSQKDWKKGFRVWYKKICPICPVLWGFSSKTAETELGMQ